MFCRNFPVTEFKAEIKGEKHLGAEIFEITHFIEGCFPISMRRFVVGLFLNSEYPNFAN